MAGGGAGAGGGGGGGTATSSGDTAGSERAGPSDLYGSAVVSAAGLGAAGSTAAAAAAARSSREAAAAALHAARTLLGAGVANHPCSSTPEPPPFWKMPHKGQSNQHSYLSVYHIFLRGKCTYRNNR